jgi:hypothetical protein
MTTGASMGDATRIEKGSAHFRSLAAAHPEPQAL